MAKRNPFTAQQERLERLINNVRAEVAGIKTMVDVDRGILTAQIVKIDDPSSPQIIKVSEGGGLALGGGGMWEVLGVRTEEFSHTGDLLETEAFKVTVPANRMGPNGVLRLTAIFRGMGTGYHVFKTKFGGSDVKAAWYAGNNLMVDTPPAYVWNRGAADSQGSGLSWGISHLRNTEAVQTYTKDTTADVDVTFTIQNSTVAGDTAYLRFALVELLHQN